MRELATVVLHHVMRDGSHYDWMLSDPSHGGDADGGWLRVYRVSCEPRHWAEAGVLMLTALPAHRGVYLGYEGAISGGRGRVRRAAAGTYVQRLWTAGRCVIELRLCGRKTCWELGRVCEPTWRARRLAGGGRGGMLRGT